MHKTFSLDLCMYECMYVCTYRLLANSSMSGLAGSATLQPEQPRFPNAVTSLQQVSLARPIHLGALNIPRPKNRNYRFISYKRHCIAGRELIQPSNDWFLKKRQRQQKTSAAAR